MPSVVETTPGHRPLWTNPADDWNHYAEFLGRLNTDRQSLLPDFLIVAPPKTGTTWVASVLGTHPAVFVAPSKELHYFDNGWRSAPIDRYVDAFAGAGGKVKGEATPTYALLPVQSIRAIHRLKPDLKLIMLVRRPPERIWSHLKHSALFREDVFRDAEGGLAGLDERAMWRFALGDYSRSCTDYSGIIDRWSDIFGDAQMLVADLESLVANPEAGMGRIFRFLGVDPPPDWSSYGLSEALNVGAALDIPCSFRAALECIHAEPSAAFAEMTAIRFGVSPAWTWPLASAGPWPLWVADDPAGAPILFDGKGFASGATRAETLGALRDRLAGRSDATARDRRLAGLIDALATDMRHYGAIRPAGELLGFNFFVSETRAIAVEQALGEVDIALDDERLLRRYSPSQLILGQTPGEVAARVVALALDRGLAKGRRDSEAVTGDVRRHREIMDRRFVDLEATIAERSKRLLALEETTARLDERIRGSEGALQERTQRLQSLEGGRTADLSRLAELEGALRDRTDRLLALEAASIDRTDRLLALEAALSERTERLAALERDAHAQAMTGDLPRRLAARLADAEAVASEAMRELAALRRDRLAAERETARAQVAAAQEEVAAAAAAAAGRRSASLEAIESRLNVLTAAFKSAQ